MSQIIFSENFEAKTVTKAEMIAAFRRYLGLPYRTQGRDELGTDCGGLFLMVSKDLGLNDLEVFGYSQKPDGETFKMILDAHLLPIDPKEAVEVADVIVSDYGDGIQHIMLVSEINPRIKVIHAKRGIGVCEQSLNGKDFRGWAASYRFKTVV